MPTIGRELADNPSFSVGQYWQPLLGEKDEQRVYGVTCETTRTRIDDNQGSRSVLGQS
jgi:hypothetical protein